MNPTPKNTFRFVSIRTEDHRFENGAIISFDSFIRKPGDVDNAWKDFKEAITKWTTTTEKGKAAWTNSREDFNIGDALLHNLETSKEFQDIADTVGIHNLTILEIETGHHRNFDEVLVNHAEDSDTEKDEELESLASQIFSQFHPVLKMHGPDTQISEQDVESLIEQAQSKLRGDTESRKTASERLRTILLRKARRLEQETPS